MDRSDINTLNMIDATILMDPEFNLNEINSLYDGSGGVRCYYYVAVKKIDHLTIINKINLVDSNNCCIFAIDKEKTKLKLKTNLHIMTIKDTIKSMIIMYPSIFPTKLSVYNHLFLTNGNGYRWKNGELISDDDKENCSIEDGLEKLFKNESQYRFLESYLDVTTDPEYIINYFKRRNEENLELAKVIVNYEKIINEKLFITNEEQLYPLCKYAKILNIPNDIKDDWKNAIKEFLDFIMTSEENKVIIYKNRFLNELFEIQYKNFIDV